MLRQDVGAQLGVGEDWFLLTRLRHVVMGSAELTLLRHANNQQSTECTR